MSTRDLTASLRSAVKRARGSANRLTAPAGTLGDLPLEPVSRRFGLDRGRPIDRYYIESWLEQNRDDVRGRVLEIGDDTYTRRIGGDRVTKSDVLNVVPGVSSTTIVADLQDAAEVPDASFDCIICTQTLPFIFTLEPVVATLHRVLAPGGVLLATVAGISQISRFDMDRWGDYWRFTSRSLHDLLATRFGDEVAVTAHGNVAAAAAFLYGLAVEDVAAELLAASDPDYELVLGARAIRTA